MNSSQRHIPIPVEPIVIPEHSSKAQQLHIKDEGSIGWDDLHHRTLSALTSKAAALCAAMASHSIVQAQA